MLRRLPQDLCYLYTRFIFLSLLPTALSSKYEEVTAELQTRNLPVLSHVMMTWN